MIDVQGPLITGGLVAVIGALVQIYSIIQDRRKAKSKDARAEAKEPSVKRAMDLNDLDKYTVIQQRLMDSQSEDNKNLRAENARLTAENKTLRDQMMDMFLQIRGMERHTPPHSPDDDSPT